ncbi:MAG: pyrophosphate-dependent phosphofructokinase [Acidimicrobiaceae bacterium]|jgi:phosphofructokinase-like protein|nr:pyrophosphate-dependent phosphofructokinase [Acidimicrobiaceae bacterium]
MVAARLQREAAAGTGPVRQVGPTARGERNGTEAMRLGVLTGGGDCPGLNAAIRAVVRKATVTFDDDIVGFRNGWHGVVEDDAIPLDVARCRGILPRGGTILGTSRVNPFKVAGGVDRALATLERRGIDGVVAIGGEGTLSVARRLAETGVPVVGIPKTIDNDVNGTDFTIGFNTAVQVAVEAIDRLHTTAESHDRIMVCEVMGRHVGWVALYSGLAAGAAIVLVPEEPFDLPVVAKHLGRRHEKGRFASIVVVAEGAKPRAGTLELPPPEIDEFDHERLGGIGAIVARELEQLTQLECRFTILGHVLRGGTPTAFDRILATRFGIAAVDAIHDRAFGDMVGLQGSTIERLSLAEATGELKRLDSGLLDDVARIFLD